MTTLHDFHISGGIIPFEMEIDEPSDRSQEGATLKLSRDCVTCEYAIPEHMKVRFFNVMRTRKVDDLDAAMKALSEHYNSFMEAAE